MERFLVDFSSTRYFSILSFIVWDKKSFWTHSISFPLCFGNWFFPELTCFLQFIAKLSSGTKTHNQRFAFQHFPPELQVHWEHGLPFMLLKALANVSPCCRAQISVFSVSNTSPCYLLLDP